MATVIISDSTCDIPKSLIEELNIKIIPLKVIFSGVEYIDGVDITAENFYDKLRVAEELPSTSQVNPDEFMKMFAPIIKNGDDILCMMLNGKLSGTYQSAVIAKAELGSNKIRLIEGNGTTVQMGILIVAVAKLNAQNMPIDELYEKASEMNKKATLYGIVDTLEYLKKGGRLSVTKAALGTMLKVKPILTVDDGVINVLSSPKGQKKAIRELKNIMDDNGHTFDGKDIMIGHSDDLEKEALFINFINEFFKPTSIIKSHIGAVIGTHVGPGCVCVGFIAD